MGSESQTPRNGGGHRVGMQPLPRQNSIYSLTLEQFQSTMVEPGKSFGSMNMDDFLKNIWTVEENQAMAAALGGMNDAAPGGLARQQSLQLQGLLTLPRTLSKKTVDEVWKDIHKEPAGTLKEGGKSEPDRQPRQLTFGEMTLEDFLLKAGVVKEDLDLPSQSFTPYVGGIGNQANLAGGVGSPFGKKENGMVAGSEASSGIVTNVPLHVNVLTSDNVVDSIQLDSYKNVVPTPRDWLSHPYQRPTVASMAKGQQHQLQEAEVSSYLNTTKRIENGTISAAGIGGMNAASGFAPLGGIGLVGGVSKGGGGIGLTSGLAEGLGPGGLGMGTCSSASDEIDPSYCNEYGFSPVGSYGIDGGLTGRKRGALGLVEKVADRRQRRMIKNRESAARSRARKQAYTMELEAEVSQLKEENFRLRIQQEEDVERRKQQMHDIMASLAQEMRSKTKVLRRTQTGPW